MVKPPAALPAKTLTQATPSAIRVALLSDSRLFRSGLRQILERARWVSLVGEAGAPPIRDFVRACAPHILLVDAKIEDVFAVCHELRQLGVRPRVILAGADEDDVWALSALKAGAHGILPRSATVENLLKAVRVIHDGEVWASKRVLTLTVEELAVRCGPASPWGQAIKTRLSRREHDIAQLIASGLRNQEVARRLAITEATVKAHLTHIFQKLMLRGRGQLAAIYHQSQLLPAEKNSARAGGTPMASGVARKTRPILDGISSRVDSEGLADIS